MRTILLIDDDLFVTSLYQTKLSNEGFRVETANNGVDALSKLETFRPDIVVLDLNMPKMNGVEVLKSIRTHPELKNVPVIVFSNGSSQNLLDEVCPLGIKKVFTKSQCPPNRLISEIESALKSLSPPNVATGAPPASALEAATASPQLAGNSDIPIVDTTPELQRQALVRLYQKVEPEVKDALAGEAGSRRELLGRAIQGLLEDLYENPEHISAASVETLKRGLENLNKPDAAPVHPVRDSEAALKGILNAFGE